MKVEDVFDAKAFVAGFNKHMAETTQAMENYGVGSAVKFKRPTGIKFEREHVVGPVAQAVREFRFLSESPTELASMLGAQAARDYVAAKSVDAVRSAIKLGEALGEVGEVNIAETHDVCMYVWHSNPDVFAEIFQMEDGGPDWLRIKVTIRETILTLVDGAGS